MHRGKGVRGVRPNCWGPSGWHFIHSIAYAYNPINNKIKRDYLEYFIKLGDVIPCDECREHYAKNLNTKENVCFPFLNNVSPGSFSTEIPIFNLSKGENRIFIPKY